MAYLTDKKRVSGLGSARKGTDHHWSMILSSVALLVLVPIFIIVLGGAIGAGYDAALERLSNPFNAIIIALTFAVGMHHFKGGVQTLIEDYVHGIAGTIAIIVMTLISYGAAAAALFAIARIAL